MCEKDFISLVEKKKHIRNHKTHECEHCETKFTRWTELMHHKRVDHGSLGMYSQCSVNFQEIFSEKVDQF